MTIILKNFSLEKGISKVLENKIIVKSLNIIKEKKVLFRNCSLIVIGVIAIAISMLATGITFGFDIEYSGKIIGTVSQTSVAQDAREIVINSIEGENVDKALPKTNLMLTLTVTDKLENATTLANNIIENTDEIISGSTLIVNGDKIACIDTQTLNSLISERKSAFNIEGAENQASFVDRVEIIDGKFLSYEMDNLDYIKNVINNLQVKTVATVTTDETIAHDSKVVYSNKYERGYSSVTEKGENGINRKVEVIEAVNGEVISKNQISNEIVKKSITKVTVFGTKTPKVSESQNASASAAGFICPINKGQYTITSYWGDGRGHRGIDLAAKKGVAIYAAASGTVVENGYRSDYGYYITIDHGNGLKTKYAHCNSLAVKKGTKVSRGDFVATVGNTGRSTGNHLHFEVIVNGTRVNPSPYIGLK